MGYLILICSFWYAFLGNSEPKMSWSRQNTLTCADFRADNRHFFKGNDAESCIDWDCNFKYQYSVAAVQATCNFNCEKSWFDKRHCDNKWLLNHEQRHFDIGEAHIRLFRKKLAEVKFVSEWKISKTVFGLMEVYLQQSNQAQAKYDLETNHGLNRIAQKKWDASIDSMLFANINFQSTLVTMQIVD